MTAPSHHVAWADRVGLNKTWSRAIEHISETYGTARYPYAVWGLQHLIVNIKNGPQLKSLIDDYLVRWYKKKSERLKKYSTTFEGGEEGCLDSEKGMIENEMLPLLANFMVQTLEDHGFGMYESEEVPRGRDGYQHNKEED